MQKIHNPNGAPAAYSDGIETPADARTLYLSGQVGIKSDKSIPSGITEQTEVLFANMKSILESADMTFEDIVKTTVYMTNPDDYKLFAATRSKLLGDVKPASTLVYVSGLVFPELLVEVEGVAVK
ncbi:RidA family protein [Hyphococcus luteus]|nr:RidA family protein [Marinicaulis flavus]